MKSKRNGEKDFKSKNLYAERRRRQKLKDLLMALRSIVPNITDVRESTSTLSINVLEFVQVNARYLQLFFR